MNSVQESVNPHGKRDMGWIQRWHIVETARGRTCRGWINGRFTETGCLTYVDKDSVETVNCFYRLGEKR